MDLEEIRYEDVEWIQLAQENSVWRAFVNSILLETSRSLIINFVLWKN
jgi:hypothetical protein